MGEGLPQFSRAEWIAVIADSLVKRDLVSLCGRLGIEFPGRRPDSMSERALAEPLAEIVTSAPGPDRDLVLQRLESSNRMIADRVASLGVEELKEALNDPDRWPRTATPGRLLWALRTDSRAGARRLASDFGEAIGSVDEFLDRLAEPRPGVRDAVATEKLSEIASGERRRAERRIVELEEQAVGLRKQVAERDQRLAARKAELEAAQESARRLDRELEGARGRLKAQPSESWESERRRLTHEVAELRRELAQSQESARRDLEASERRREEEARKEREAGEALRREIEAARKDAAWLREKLKTPVAPPPAAKRDPDRVAVFAEVQSLYFLAVARRSRVDYRQVLERGQGEGRLGRALAYVVDLPGIDAAPFKQVLQGFGFQVRSRPGTDARAWTAGLDTDLRDAARTCGRIAIATANPDLANVLGSLAAEGVHVTLISFEDPRVATLRSAASAFEPIGSDMLRPLPARG